MNNVYFAQCLDRTTEFDSYLIVSSNKIMKNGFVKLIYSQLCANERGVSIHTFYTGESELQCGVYTKEGLKMFEDESNSILKLW